MSVKVQDAEAYALDDKRQIMQLIEQGPGFEPLNCSVRKFLQRWVCFKNAGFIYRTKLVSGPVTHLNSGCHIRIVHANNALLLLLGPESDESWSCVQVLDTSIRQLDILLEQGLSSALIPASVTR